MKKLFLKLCFFLFRKLRKIGIKIKMPNKEKEYIISKALKTEEGKQELAKAMIEPIRGWAVICNKCEKEFRIGCSYFEYGKEYTCEECELIE
jgi:hypothetical protein